MSLFDVTYQQLVTALVVNSSVTSVLMISALISAPPSYVIFILSDFSCMSMVYAALNIQYVRLHSSLVQKSFGIPVSIY